MQRDGVDRYRQESGREREQPEALQVLKVVSEVSGSRKRVHKQPPVWNSNRGYAQDGLASSRRIDSNKIEL